jgi:hypothetical protein
VPQLSPTEHSVLTRICPPAVRIVVALCRHHLANLALPPVVSVLPLLLTNSTFASHVPLVELPSNGNYQLDDLDLLGKLYVDTQRTEAATDNQPGDSPPARAKTLSSSPPPSVLFQDDAFTLNSPAFGRALLAQHVDYRVGWVSTQTLYRPPQNQHYAYSSIASGGSLPLPDVGFGAYGMVKPNPQLAITAGIHEDVMHRWNSDDVDRNAYFSALGINYQAASPTSGSDQYILTLWRRNGTEQGAGGRGFALKVAREYHQQINWSPFLNVSYRKTDIGDETIASTGISLFRLPWNPDESAGFAYAHQKVSGTGAATHTVEVYYRLMPKPYLEVTPNLQLVYQPQQPTGLQQSIASRLNFRLLF